MAATGWILIGAAACILAFVAGVIVGDKNLEWRTAEHLEAWSLVEQLREPEGAAVTLCCDNPDFQGPNSVVEIVDDWTDWLPRRFEGETVLVALRNARRMRGDI